MAERRGKGGEESGGMRVLARTQPDASTANDAVVVGAAAAGALSGLAFAITLLLGGPIAAYGSFLAFACFSLAIAIRRYFVDRFGEIEAAEPRYSPDQRREEEAEPLSPISPATGRRPFLTRALLGAAGVFGASLLALVPSLGPKVGSTLRSTPWARGKALVTTDDEMIRPEDVTVGGILTAWPRGDIGFERAAVLVLRLSEPPLEPTNMEWVVRDDIVAYSKICTHAGCPVALFRERDDALFCPCHQSTFDVRRACKPIFGPAARRLPQLPLTVNNDGFLVALGDFEEQAGPAFG